MKCPVRVFPGRRIVLGGLVGWLSLSAAGCTPQVVRSAQPATPTSAVELVEDSARLDRLIAAGALHKEELKRARDQAQRLLEQLGSRRSQDDGLYQITLSRTQLALELYEKLLQLAEQKVDTRGERAALAEQADGFIRDYLRASMALEQNLELLPAAATALTSSGESALQVELLPPPPTSHLLEGLRAGRFDQVIREVEAAGPDALGHLDPLAVAAYALALGGEHRYEQALTVAARLDARALLPDEVLQLRYREALWLVKSGKHEQAAQALVRLSQDAQIAGHSLGVWRGTALETLDDIRKSTPRFAEALVDIRLALADGRFEEARATVSRLLETESSVEAVNRLEGLLKQIDTAEEQAFTARLAEIQVHARTGEGLEPARRALDQLALAFPGNRFRDRLEAARAQLTALSPVAGAGATGRDGSGGPGAAAASDVAVSAGAAGSSAPAADLKPAPGASGGSSGLAADMKPADAGGGSSAPATGTPETAGTAGAASTPVAATPGAAGGASAPATSTAAAGTAGGASTAATSTGAVGTAGAAGTPATGTATGAAGGASTPGAGTVAKAAPTGASASPQGTSSGAGAPGQPGGTGGAATDWQKLLTQGRNQMTAGRYADAVKTFTLLTGTPGEAEAMRLKQKAIDEHVQHVRERVAREYVRAQSLKSDQEKLLLLGEIYDALKTALETYPETSLRMKAEHNLKVIEAELVRLEPAYFSSHEAFKPEPAANPGGARP